MDYREAFHTIYLRQQGLVLTPENIKAYSVDSAQLTLLYETPCYWIILHDTGDCGAWLDVIWKAADVRSLRMESIEL